MLICMQKINFTPHFFFWDIEKILQTCYFGYFGHTWLWPVKTLLPACRKLWCLSLCKKIIFIPSLFLETLQRYYKFGYFGHTWIRTSKVIAPTCRKLWCLSANEKTIWPLNFLGILHFKEFCDLFGQEHFGQYLENKNFARHGVCDGKSRIKRTFILHCF